MKKVLFLMLFLTIMRTAGLNAQVAIGDNKTPEDYSLLELVSNGSRALRLPQLTTVQRDALAVSGQALAEGLIIFNTDTKCIEYWSGTLWISQCAPTAIKLSGGAINGPAGSVNPGVEPGEITSILPSSGGTTPYTYSWEYCLGDCNDDTKWKPATALCSGKEAAKSSYQPCGLNNTMQFRRKVTDTDGTIAVSNQVIAVVNLVAGQITPPASLPPGGDMLTLNATASTGGWSTTHSHRWKYCTSGCENAANWYDVTDAKGGYTCSNTGTNLNYATCKITSNMWFHRLDSDGDKTQQSNTVLVEVSTALPKPASTDIVISSTSTAVCVNSATSITASVRSGLTPSPTNPTFYLYDDKGNVVGTKTGSSVTFDVNPATTPNTTYYVSFKATNYDENPAADRKQVQIPVAALVTPTISLSLSTAMVATNEKVDLLAIVTNEGTNPTYQWMVDNNPVGSNSPTFSTSWTTTGSHNITCKLTSNAPCSTTATVTATQQSVTVTPYGQSCKTCAEVAKKSAISKTDFPYWYLRKTGECLIKKTNTNQTYKTDYVYKLATDSWVTFDIELWASDSCIGSR